MGDAALVLIDPADRDALNLDGLALDGLDRVAVRVVRYADMETEADSIARQVDETGIKLVLYSRNDQVFERRMIGSMIRRLRTGYSSFSGIDPDMAWVQAQAALSALKGTTGKLKLPAPEPPSVSMSPEALGTFSLIFDTEQIGCVLFGMPRILELLDIYGVRATFFVTGFIHHLCPDLLPALAAHGHAIGIHGPYHEWLAGLPLEEQQDRLIEHVAEFRKHYPVVGANFIFRMDANTIRALASAGLRYCVAFSQHHYRPFAYRRPSSQPLPVNTEDGSIWLVPIPVETYSLPWFATRKLIDSALVRSRADGGEHVSVLMHPFRDGSKRHLGQLETMLRYLTQTRRLIPVTLDQHVPEPAPDRVTSRIFTSIERIDGSHPEAYSRQLWSRSELYFERLSTIYRTLCALGHQPALSLEREPSGRTFAVYPEVPAGQAQMIPFDPLAGNRIGSSGWRRLFSLLDRQDGLHVFGPPGPAEQLRVLMDLGMPRHAQDLTGLAPETAVRLAYRLRRSRLLF